MRTGASDNFSYIAMDITIKTPNNFNFRRTVLSHGWCALPPFEFDKESWTLFRVLGSDKPLTAKISARNGAIKVTVSRRLGREAVQKIARDVRHMFRLDDDLSEFYQAVEAEPEFVWISNEGAGRLLRSPTVFEDLVKMICTTNCSWALTEKMVNGLVNELGSQSDDGRKSFPSAEVMAQESVKFFKDKIRSEAEPEFVWISNEGAGRLLRSPTVFEDLVKMICTTNCSWALTEKMVNGLVNELGSQSDDGRKSFPSAEVMAQESVKFFKDKIRAGYR